MPGQVSSSSASSKPASVANLRDRRQTAATRARASCHRAADAHHTERHDARRQNGLPAGQQTSHRRLRRRAPINRDCRAEARRAKEHPAQRDERERDTTRASKTDAAGRACARGRCPTSRSMQSIAAVESAPRHERPLRAVPEAAQEHRQHQVAQRGRLAVAAAAQRNVQVIAQPRRERDVPAVPEIRDARRQVRHAEVLRKDESEQARAADRDVAVA